jgi:hypothetical protein
VVAAAVTIVVQVALAELVALAAAAQVEKVLLEQPEQLTQAAAAAVPVITQALAVLVALA